MAEKLQIARHFDKNNVLYVNSDNDLLKTIADGSCDDLRLAFLKDKHVVSFSVSGSGEYHAENIHIKDGRSALILSMKICVCRYPCSSWGCIMSAMRLSRWLWHSITASRRRRRKKVWKHTPGSPCVSRSII